MFEKPGLVAAAVLRCAVGYIKGRKSQVPLQFTKTEDKDSSSDYALPPQGSCFLLELFSPVVVGGGVRSSAFARSASGPNGVISPFPSEHSFTVPTWSGRQAPSQRFQERGSTCRGGATAGEASGVVKEYLGRS